MAIILGMKRLILSHLLLNIYLLAMFQPMYPVVEYVVNYDYIVDQLCENRDRPVMACNGKCYLGKQLQEGQESSGDPTRPLPPSVDFEKLTVTGPEEFDYSLLEWDLLNSKDGFRPVELPMIFNDPLLRPPIL